MPWLAAGAISLVALTLVMQVRPDPKRIAELLGSDEDRAAAAAPAAPLREVLAPARECGRRCSPPWRPSA